MDGEEEPDVDTIEISTIFQTIPKDNRPYAKVKIFKTEMMGLWDSGACVSLLGNKADLFIAPRYLSAPKIVRKITTADGTRQPRSGSRGQPTYHIQWKTESN